MEIVKEGNTLTVTGSVVKFDDYDVVKKTAAEILSSGDKQLNIVFEDSMTINSALIGFMIKIVRVDNVNLSLTVGNPKLYDMLNTLSLAELLKVSKK